MEERCRAIQWSKFIETTDLLDHSIILVAEEMSVVSAEHRPLNPDLDCLQHKQPLLTELWSKITMKKEKETIDG